MSRLNETILIIPGDEPTIEFLATQWVTSSPFPGEQPLNLTNFVWSFVVLNKATDADSSAIFTITVNSGDAPLGQAYFIVSTTQSSMLSRGTKYYFRVRWIDPGSIPFTAWAGSVSTGC